MKIDGGDYTVVFDRAANTVRFTGTLRLFSSGDYRKIEQLLLEVYNLELKEMVMDFGELLFMNSLGINMLCKFIIRIKKLDKMPVRIVGNKNILWQVKTFQNLKLLWDKIELQFA